LTQTSDLNASSLEQGFGAISLVEHGQYQVLGLDVGMIAGQRQGLGFLEGLAKFGGQFVNSHGVSAANDAMLPSLG
jgi:hypothetical protein